MKPPDLKSVKGSVDKVALDAKIKSLESQLKASEKSLSQITAAFERAKETPKFGPFIPSGVRKGLKTDITRVLIPDTHGAKASKTAVEAVLGDIKALDADEIVLLGDHVDCGGFLAQHHTMGFVAETNYTYESDIAATNAFLDAVQASAPRAWIRYIEGNHERRIEQWAVTQSLRNSRDADFLRRSFAPEFLLSLKERGINYYRQSECYDGLSLQGTIKIGPKCYATHGSSTSKQATTTMLAAFAGNLVFGHTHREQSSSARPVHSGQIRAWNPGCLCELQPLWLHTMPTSWTHGYAIQNQARSGEFIHLNVPVIHGRSLLGALASKFK